ncbi:interferon phi 1 [Takifugu rubripes]|uniref:interferon phi 1 n=1 Tax=Takifugu rubripes TaxID=31033 RepID=UPI0011459B65|nr:interferon a3-like [Takifugu rubripes]
MISMSAVTLEDKQIRFHFLSSGITSLHFIIIRMKTASRNKRLCCDWLAHFGHLSNQSLSLIRIMGGPLTNQQSPVSFPKELYGRAHNATVDFQLAFLRDSLKLIQRLWLKLFQHDELSSVTWGTTNTEHFLMTILRQHREVKRCVSKKKEGRQKTCQILLDLGTAHAAPEGQQN